MLSGVMFGLGLIFLVVPGVVWLLWTLVASVVVAIEGRSGWDALMRSRELGRGYYVRNGVIMLLSFLVYFVVLFLVAVAIGALTGAVVGTGLFENSLRRSGCSRR